MTQAGEKGLIVDSPQTKEIHALDQSDSSTRRTDERDAACGDGQADRCADVLGKHPDTPEARKKMKGWVYEVAEDADYNGGTAGHKAPFYFIEVRLPAGRFDVLTKRHMILDFTKIILLAEGNAFAPESANRIWVTIVELKEEDWGIGGHIDWLRDYESALTTLGTELKPRS
jgi:hypothetical protein